MPGTSISSSVLKPDKWLLAMAGLRLYVSNRASLLMRLRRCIFEHTGGLDLDLYRLTLTADVLKTAPGLEDLPSSALRACGCPQIFSCQRRAVQVNCQPLQLLRGVLTRLVESQQAWCVDSCNSGQRLAVQRVLTL